MEKQRVNKDDQDKNITDDDTVNFPKQIRMLDSAGAR